MQITKAYNLGLEKAQKKQYAAARVCFDSVIGYLASQKLAKVATGKTILEGQKVDAWIEKCWCALEVHDLLLGDDFGRMLD